MGTSRAPWGHDRRGHAGGRSSKLEMTRRYIARQKQHHLGVDFKAEVREFLSKYNLEWDERYAWD